MEYLPYIFPCSCGHSSPHVGKYTIHGSYGKVPYYWHGKKLAKIYGDFFLDLSLKSANCLG